ncbi:MAG: isocitrate/isopropylmalate dehydrogenase family protein [Pseudoxanthomonas sp.]
MKNPYRIVVIPGDGIGPEVMDVTLRVLEAVATPDLVFDFAEYPTGSAHFARTGEVLSDALIEDCRASDAILLAAIGLPEVRRAEGTEVQPEIVVGLRMKLDLYAAIRPIKLYPGVASTLKTTEPGIDFVILRENTEGLFASFGGGARVGDQVSADNMIITRKGTERISEFAFRLAARRKGRPTDGRSRVTCVDKANVFRSLAFFRKVFEEVAARHPQIESESIHVDAMCMYMLQRPWDFDVLVMENMFGDILSDLGAALVGGLGLGPSAEIGDGIAMFQPSHGSAPTIAGQDLANPLATVLSAAMMLDWLGHANGDSAATQAAARIEMAVQTLLREGKTLTPDLGGKAGTRSVGAALIDSLAICNATV